MDQSEFGKMIAVLRRKAGYTQQSLATVLGITDKAVSKWERGLCLPDSTILPKLAGLLDTDLGTLIPERRTSEPWRGLIILKKSETSPLTPVNGKPLIHYLLSYFLLLGITDVNIVTDQMGEIRQTELTGYGLHISFGMPVSSKLFVIYGKTLLFGSYLSHQLANMMGVDEDVIPVIDGADVPFLFSHRKLFDLETAISKAKRRSLYRGIVNIPLETEQQADDATAFIRLYEKYHAVSFCDLMEIAKSRGILP